MSDEIVIATKNLGKLNEFSSLLNNHFKKIYSLIDFESIPEIVEDGKTFSENALKKARVVCSHLERITLADDSGLVVDSLGGEPGIYSARYAGDCVTDDENIDKLLYRLEGVQDRKARFVCDLALVYPSGEEFVFEGICEGLILDEKRNGGGFGYDPVFFIPQIKKTMAEISSEQKNKISHRSNAVKKLIKYLKSEI